MIKNKEELIGTEWKCPMCGEKIIITVDGINHQCKNHQYMAKRDLAYLFSCEKFTQECDNRFLYGDKNGPQDKSWLKQQKDNLINLIKERNQNLLKPQELKDILSTLIDNLPPKQDKHKIYWPCKTYGHLYAEMNMENICNDPECIICDGFRQWMTKNCAENKL